MRLACVLKRSNHHDLYRRVGGNALFNLRVMEETQRTQGFKNKLCVLVKVLWWVKLNGKAMNRGSPLGVTTTGSPAWCNHCLLRSGTGSDVLVTFPLPLVL